MALTADSVPARVKLMLEYRGAERNRLDRVFQYLRDPNVENVQMGLQGHANGPLRWLPTNSPDEVKRLAEISRVNMLKFVVNAVTQVMYVDGFRAPHSEGEEPSWETWQANRMDARQIGIHRAGLSYGASYATVLPGDTAPVIRGASPRNLTAVYGDDDDWPETALELRRTTKKDVDLYRLYDDQNAWWVEVGGNGIPHVVGVEEHGLGVCPVVRFISAVDDDGVVEGEVEPLIPIQDQINITTFGLLVAQHYGAFRQRYILGWIADTEEKALTASARKLWAFEDPEVKVGEFEQTNLDGYIASREASLRHLATVSQTPAHELLGQLVNLSAEALTAAEANHRRKVLERQTTFGESWEQVLELAGQIKGQKTDIMASVRWRDTEARSLAQVADALGKLVATLGVPPQELWDKIPGTTQQEIARWKVTAQEGDAFAQLATQLNRASGPPGPDAPISGPKKQPSQDDRFRKR